MKKILVPIPRYGFDPTEAAIPWRYLVAGGVQVVFATPDGSQGRADVRMVTGEGLGPFRRTLMADAEAVSAYHELENASEFKAPLSYGELRSGDFDAIFLPGGHDKGVREYLESECLQRLIVEFFEQDKSVASICHGTLLVARSVSPATGRSVLWGRKITGLTKWQEWIAYQLTRLQLGDYYLTYPGTTTEDELRSFLRDPADFSRGPGVPVPTRRDSASDLSAGFTIRDGNYLSGRWPGDIHRFGTELVAMVGEAAPARDSSGAKAAEVLEEQR